MKVETKVLIQIEKTEYKLSIEEARNLYTSLGELFNVPSPIPPYKDYQYPPVFGPCKYTGSPSTKEDTV